MAPVPRSFDRNMWDGSKEFSNNQILENCSQSEQVSENYEKVISLPDIDAPSVSSHEMMISSSSFPGKRLCRRPLNGVLTSYVPITQTCPITKCLTINDHGCLRKACYWQAPTRYRLPNII